MLVLTFVSLVFVLLVTNISAGRVEERVARRPAAGGHPDAGLGAVPLEGETATGGGGRDGGGKTATVMAETPVEERTRPSTDTSSSSPVFGSD